MIHPVLVGFFSVLLYPVLLLSVQQCSRHAVLTICVSTTAAHGPPRLLLLLFCLSCFILTPTCFGGRVAKGLCFSSPMSLFFITISHHIVSFLKKQNKRILLALAVIPFFFGGLSLTLLNSISFYWFTIFVKSSYTFFLIELYVLLFLLQSLTSFPSIFCFLLISAPFPAPHAHATLWYWDGTWSITHVVPLFFCVVLDMSTSASMAPYLVSFFHPSLDVMFQTHVQVLPCIYLSLVYILFS